MDSLHTINGKPVGNPTVTQAPEIIQTGNPTVTASAAAVKLQTHAAACGEVGIVGEVGDLGSNAAK